MFCWSLFPQKRDPLKTKRDIGNLGTETHKKGMLAKKTSHLMLPTFLVLLVSFPKETHKKQRVLATLEKRLTKHNIHCFVGLFSKRDPQSMQDVGKFAKETHGTQIPLFCGSIFQNPSRRSNHGNIGKETNKTSRMLANEISHLALPTFLLIVGLFSKRDPQKIRDAGHVGKETNKTQHCFVGLFSKRDPHNTRDADKI